MERVVLAIAAKAGDRVKVVEFGKSTEGRPSKANAKAVDTYVSDGTNWYVLGTEPAGFNGPIRTERFPGEPWPPEFQR